VREYIPEFRLHDPIATDRVTVRDLLCHHSGLPRHDWIWMPGDLTCDQMLAVMLHLEPCCDIRTRFLYQNLGYMVAGMVAERITGRSWADFTRERLLKPLGIRHVGFSVEELEAAADGARPYEMIEQQRRRARMWPIRTTPSGGINASIAGMANYLRFHLAEGRFDGVRLLSANLIRMMQTPRVFTGWSEFEEFGAGHYGFGLESHHYRGERLIQHGGAWIGWATLLSMVPDRRLGIVVLTNRDESPVTDILTLAIVDRLSGKDPVDWLERFKSRKLEALAQGAADREAHSAVRRSEAGHARPLSEYAGEYEHPGYGRITIEAGEGALSWHYRGLAAVLSHRHFETFEVPENSLQVAADPLPVTFSYDRESNIDRLSLPLEPLVAEVVFKRRPGGDVLDPAFRAACVGVYRHGPKHQVIAQDAQGQLTLSFADQETYSLFPYRDRTFDIRELPGFRAEFQRNDAGVVDTIIFHQPDGTFTARRARAVG
jgi:CubicO group peptidase (beta-lactamase class C family)